MEARNVFPIMFTKRSLRLSPKKVRKYSPPKEDSLKVLYYEKLKKVINAGYIEKGYSNWDVRFLVFLKVLITSE